MAVKTLTIDGRQATAAEGETILEVARQNGINIPTLCNKTGLTPTGQCRLCMVEIAGSNRLIPSCVS
jgi:bidirectional [NiFe] hydrogenase diaphorase subunit